MSDTDVVARLNELKALLDGGILTQDEFDTLKKKRLAPFHSAKIHV